MQRLLFFLVCLQLPIAIFAQIGVNTTNPDTSSILDISSTNKGLLIPRMSAFDVQAIKNPRNSLLVYDTTNARYLYYLKPNWHELNPIKAPFTNDSVTISKKLSIGDPLKPVGQKLTVNGSAVVKEGIVAKQVTVGANGLNVQGQTVLSKDLQVELDLTTLGDINVSGSVNATGISVPGFGLVPKGVIVMWSGTIKTIPTGWALCDGRNGTPDLRGRFVVGYDSTDTDYNTVSKLGPTHTDADGTFTGTSTQEAKQIRLTANQSGLRDHSHYLWTFNNTTRRSNGNQSDVPTTDNGNVQTSGVIGNAQNAIDSHENRPPFYVLAYIIKL